MNTYYTILEVMTILLLIFLLFSLNNERPEDKPEIVTDIDGNIYHTVKIGDQVWMAENLKTTKYRNGDPIPNVTDNEAWGDLNSGAYCCYNNDSSTYKGIYGALYNWFAVTDIRNIVPKGRHVPTDQEWGILIDFLGGKDCWRRNERNRLKPLVKPKLWCHQ